MTLNYVTLILDLYDGQGNQVITGSAALVPSSVLTDAADQVIITQDPIPAVFRASGLPQVTLLATDNSAPQPSGWTWGISFTGMPAPVSPFSFFLPHAGGATQHLSNLIPAATGNMFQAYMPLPTGGRLSFVTVSPKGLGSGAAIANNGADYGPDTPGTVTSGIQEAVNYAISQALAGQGSPDVVLLGGKFTLSSFSNTAIRAAVAIDSGYDATAIPAVSVTIRGTGYASGIVEGTTFTDAWPQGTTVIDASGLDVLAQGLYKQGRVFGVVPRKSTGTGLVNTPLNAIQLVMENMAIILPTYMASGTTGPAYTLNGTSSKLFTAGDTQNSAATHWEFVNGIDAWSASSFKVKNVAVLSSFAAYNTAGNLYAGSSGIQAHGSAAAFIFPEDANQGNLYFECISAQDVHTGLAMASHTAGDQFYAQSCQHTIYMREGGQGAHLTRVLAQEQTDVIRHQLMPQLTNSLASSFYDPVGDLYTATGLTFPSAAASSVLTISQLCTQSSFTHFLVDDASNPLTVVANVCHSGAAGPWGSSGANLMVNLIDTGANSQTVLNGTTAGTVTYSQTGNTPWAKRFTAYLSGYENTTGTHQAITFVVPYNNSPAVVKDDSGGSTVSTTTLTLPASMGAPVTGYIILDGY